MTSDEVRNLRKRLGLARPAFAQLIGVDLRTVIRWEMGTVVPSGPGAAVLTGLHTALEKAANSDGIIDVLVKAAAIGGLAYLLMTLLEDATATPKKAAPAKKRRKR